MTAKCTRIRNALAGLIAACLAASAGAVEAAEEVQVSPVGWTTGDCGSGEFKMGSRFKMIYDAGMVPRYEYRQRCVRAKFGGRDVRLVIRDRLDHARYNACPVNQFMVGIIENLRPNLECTEIHDSENRRLFIIPRGYWSVPAGDGWMEWALQCPDNQVMIAYRQGDLPMSAQFRCGTVQYQK